MLLSIIGCMHWTMESCSSLATLPLLRLLLPDSWVHLRLCLSWLLPPLLFLTGGHFHLDIGVIRILTSFSSFSPVSCAIFFPGPISHGLCLFHARSVMGFSSSMPLLAWGLNYMPLLAWTLVTCSLSLGLFSSEFPFLIEKWNLTVKIPDNFLLKNVRRNAQQFLLKSEFLWR